MNQRLPSGMILMQALSFQMVSLFCNKIKVDYTIYYRNLNTFVAVITFLPYLVCRYFVTSLLLIVCALR